MDIMIIPVMFNLCKHFMSYTKNALIVMFALNGMHGCRSLYRSYLPL